MTWYDIDKYDRAYGMVLCCHEEKKWIRFGQMFPGLNRWYYSGTNERSQWAQVEGDEPTHWQLIPELP